MPQKRPHAGTPTPAEGVEGAPADSASAKRLADGREPLTAERIVLAAIDLIDAEGLPGFTMRSLGRALGVEAMSLYGYFKSKDELLLAVRSHFYNRLDVEAPPGSSWHEQLRAVLMTSYRMGVEHPSWAAAYLHAGPVPESRSRGARDRALLRDAGLSREEAAGAMIALISYLTGFQHRSARLIRAGAPETQQTRDEAFRLGLDAIIDGLRSRAAARPGGPIT